MRHASKAQRESGKQKDWVNRNPDNKRSYALKRKSKLFNITESEWLACREYFNDSCAYCGMSSVDHKHKYNKEINKEHWDDEGLNDLSNCVPSCGSCNSKKWVFKFNDWYDESYEHYDEDRKRRVLKWIKDDYKRYIKHYNLTIS
ncbi:HNH endonuclease signature motif containing protein [Paenibacillus sp. FSL K6-1122]|uniref:HNH endonuclease signature motif containing protein n=1 Tax=Paenibacillus sp. FSL K6-1122 TaxID=2954512 RepID=UPI0030EBAA90